MKVRRSLIRLHKWQVDEKRKHLSDLLVLRDDLIARADDLAAKVRREQEVVRNLHGTATDVGYAYSAFSQSTRTQADNLRRSIDEILARISEAEEALAEAFKELKRQEIAAENQERREQAEREKKAQAEIDERAQESHRRKAATAQKWG